MANWRIWRTDYGKLTVANQHMANRYMAKRRIPLKYSTYEWLKILGI